MTNSLYHKKSEQKPISLESLKTQSKSENVSIPKKDKSASEEDMNKLKNLIAEKKIEVEEREEIKENKIEEKKEEKIPEKKPEDIPIPPKPAEVPEEVLRKLLEE